ncbi:MAG TPA: hypothetical protein VGP79_05450 [Bryobacteraceae bacterium]|jgi:hypothetical protein|nr:hypothetical protein [Bryobacteraceae bacterium]
MKFLVPLLFAALIAPAQTAAPQGVTAEWDISQMLDALASQAKRLKPILDQLNPQEWVAKGAPDAYVSQWRYAQTELVYLTDSAKALGKQPERLTLALDTLFRVQSLETRLTSLVDGVRNYQNPAVGDLLVGVLGENSTNRDRLRQYITDLAANKEQEFEIADKEAQRCRGMLGKQAPAPKPAAPPIRKKQN